MVEFDDEEEKSKYLENKYKIIFEFWYDHVIPELKKFNIRDRKTIRKFNEIFEILPNIKNEKIELSQVKKIEELFKNKLTMVTTNVVKVLMTSIHKHLESEFGDQFDTKNIFVDPIKLKIPKVINNFKELLAQNQELNIIIDCSTEIPDKTILSKASRLIFIIPNESQFQNFSKNIEICYENISKLEINIIWKDLAEDTQQMMLQTKINFQNNLQFSFGDLFGNKISKVDQRTSISFKKDDKEALETIIDNQLLKLLVTKSEISINTKLGCHKNFDLLFQPRRYVKKQSNRRSSSSFREQTENELRFNKYVLISDMAGNGKSWSMKNYEKILRIKNPLRWVTCVDLKQYIDEFKSRSDDEFDSEFSNFMVDNILKPETEFEGKIFKNFYKNGNVCILFDGFDEIAPNCADFVSELALSFECNGGNQLWIATRDYFEIDLQQKLQLDSIYKLSSFTRQDGINLIASNWILNDLKDQSNFKSKNDFEIFKRNSPKFKNYQQLADQVIQRVSMSEKESIGLPQFYKMIADIFKDNKETAVELQRSKIYEKFAQNLYKRWSEEKGKIRNEASIESQSNEMSFWKFHQYQAIASLFPELAKKFFPGYDASKWLEEEVIACGMISKIGGKYRFLHETFREFFVADFVVKELQKLKFAEKPSQLDYYIDKFRKKNTDYYVLELFSKILTHRELGVIGMFVNDAVDDTILDKVHPQMQKFINNFYKMDNLGEFFSKNLDKLANFVITVLKTGKYQNVATILKNNVRQIIFSTEDSKIFTKFLDFLFDFLKVKDLKTLIREHEVFPGIIQSNLEIEIFDDFVTKTTMKIGPDFIQERMQKFNNKWMQQKIFSFICRSPKFDLQKLHKCLEIMKKFLAVHEIIELLEMCQKEGENIMHVCIRKQDENHLIILWKEIENFFKSQNLMQNFKELIRHKDAYNKNILCWAAECEKLEFHHALWELLLNTFENREELKMFILQENWGQNFIHHLVVKNKNLSIIEITFNIMKINFNDIQFKEIVKSRGEGGMNLLQAVAYSITKIQIHRVLWKHVSDSCQYHSDFLEILKSIDFNERQILNIAACYSSSDVFEFMIEQLEKIASSHEIIHMLSHINKLNQNLLQSAVWNKSPTLQISMWNTFRKYFAPLEILNFIEHVDNKGENLLFCAFFTYSIEVIESIWTEIRRFMNYDKQLEYLRTTDGHGVTLHQWALKNRDNHKELYFWVKNVISEYETCY